MAVNRKTGPSLSALSIPRLLEYSVETLSNGAELIVLYDPDQEVVRVDVLFDAGTVYQPRPLISSTTAAMLSEGTFHHSAEEIAETFDFYGAYVDFNCGLHKIEASLFCLNKFAKETLPLFVELITESTVPEQELAICMRNRLERFKTDRQKTSWLARKKFAALLFGAQHPYANQVEEEDYGSITPDLIRQFYIRYIREAEYTVVASGNVTDDIRKQIVSAFGKSRPSSGKPLLPSFEFLPANPGRYHVEKNDAVQTTIRIGKSGVSLTDPDYTDFLLLNTVLGGYFGSRLMTNIREEKGYTYGIHSFNISMPLAAYWGIGTDVDNKYTDAVIGEIWKEIDRLRTETIGSEELTLVKNYFHGDLLREIDGVFSQADSLRHKHIYGKDNTFYTEMIRRVQQCTAGELKELAVRYLDPGDMYVVTVGKTV